MEARKFAGIFSCIHRGVRQALPDADKQLRLLHAQKGSIVLDS